MVRAEWAIFEEDYWAINNVLDDLLKSSQAKTVLLIDRTGQLVLFETQAFNDRYVFEPLCIGLGVIGGYA